MIGRKRGEEVGIRGEEPQFEITNLFCTNYCVHAGAETQLPSSASFDCLPSTRFSVFGAAAWYDLFHSAPLFTGGTPWGCTTSTSTSSRYNIQTGNLLANFKGKATRSYALCGDPCPGIEIMPVGGKLRCNLI